MFQLLLWKPLCQESWAIVLPKREAHSEILSPKGLMGLGFVLAVGWAFTFHFPVFPSE